MCRTSRGRWQCIWYFRTSWTWKSHVDIHFRVQYLYTTYSKARIPAKPCTLCLFSTILGPAVAPIVGGYIDQYLGWRWIFYIKTIMGGVLIVLNFIFLKETLYTPNSKKLAPPANFRERLARLKFNPVSTPIIWHLHSMTKQLTI